MPRRTVTIITEAAAFGGSVVHTFGLIEALVRRGAAVEVVANRFDPYTGWVAERELGQSVRVIPTELPGITPEEPAAMDTWRTLLATLRGELLIFPKGHFYHGQLPLLRAFRKKFKSVVFIEHLEAPPKPAARERPLFGFLPSLGLAWRRRKQRQRAAARCADLVIAVSSKVRDRLVRDWDASPDEIVVVRNGTRDYTFSGNSLPARPVGLIVSIYRIAADGSPVLAAQVRADGSTGQWSIRRAFSSNGRFGFVTRTGQDLQNAPGSSNVRSLLVY